MIANGRGGAACQPVTIVEGATDDGVGKYTANTHKDSPYGRIITHYEFIDTEEKISLSTVLSAQRKLSSVDSDSRILVPLDLRRH